MSQEQTIAFRGDYFGGQWHLADAPDEDWAVPSPANLKDTVIRPLARFDHVDRAVQSARDAFLPWAHLGLERRKVYLNRLKEVFLARAAEVAEIISRETGKPLWETKTEAAILANKIDITLNHSLKQVAEEEIKDALPGISGFVRFKPRGVMSVIGPFNFPAHLPNGHIIPALIAGNTIVFKPSDKTPAVGQWMAECFERAEFPKGVFNLLQGKAETGKRLVNHESVDGVLFTGSYEVGLKIKQDTLTHFRKILALEMGGKNASVIWEDADMKKAVYESLIGSFMTAGQRCSCTSRIIVHRKVKDHFVEQFYASAKKLKIGHWREPVFMGPLISSDAVEKFIRFQEIAKREGAESLMRGKALDLEPNGYYVTPSINLVKEFDPKSVYQKSEIFGPNVAIFTVDTFEEALAINNSSNFGLVMSLFTKDRALYEKALIEAQVGVLNWNRTTNGASSKLPFGGMNKSGNDRPSGNMAIQYCTVPVASLEDTTPFSETGMPVGLNFEYKG
ncbi:MAG TPA: succinylglutamate-semialdehyde dehydrogenase [Bdellovibrionales bacterium]|mgnify:CR=1 FL=1|nr:succinylglutamate-semialdehyde dehydrogenase [Bdellovibrionales bacterium]